MFNCTTIRFQPRNVFKSFILEKIRRKNLYGSIEDKTGALLGHFISAKLGKNDFILLEESKNDYERKIKRHKNNLYNK